MIRPVDLLATLLCASAAHLASAACEEVTSAEQFEELVMDSAKVWVTLFRSKKKDPEEKIHPMCEELASALTGKVGVAHVDMKVSGMKDIGGEIGVRTHNVPCARVFLSRARSASKIDIKGDDGEFLPAGVIANSALAILGDNGKAADGSFEKITLALGGGGGDELR